MIRSLVVVYALTLAGFSSLSTSPPVGAQDLRCSGFQSQDGAQAAFEAYPVRAAALDADGDGRACEEYFGPDIGDNGAATELLSSAGQDVDCRDLTSQEDAQVILDRDPEDPYNLDPNGDGVACASLPSNRSPLEGGVAFAAARPVVDADILREHNSPAATTQRLAEVDSVPPPSRLEKASDALKLTVESLEARSAPAESASTDEPDTHTITGYFEQAVGPGTPCGGRDIDLSRPASLTDATVTVSNGANEVLAVGGVVGTIEPDTVTSDTSTVCMYSFEVPNVPVADIYVIAVEGANPSGSDVGPATYSYVGLESLGWNVHLSYR